MWGQRRTAPAPATDPQLISRPHGRSSLSPAAKTGRASSESKEQRASNQQAEHPSRGDVGDEVHLE